MKRLLLVTFIIISIAGNLFAQQTLSVNAAPGGTPVTYYSGNDNQAPRAIRFDAGTVRTSTFIANINTYLNVSNDLTFGEIESNTDQLGMRHYHLQQYYRGIPLEGLSYRVHEKNGFVTSVNGKGIRELNINTQASLTEQAAFALATSHFKSKDSLFRPAKKLIVSRNFTFAPGSFVLAYQFDIDVSFIEQWRISIDARDGSVINKVSLVQSCFGETPQPPPYGIGSGLASYYGRMNIRIDKNSNGSSRLFGQTEHGGLIGTHDFQNAMSRILSLPFEINFPIFTSSSDTYDNLYQQPAVAAHWAAEQVFEYYYTTHNRNSFDNQGKQIKSYVHVDENLNNAFWVRDVMAFGDGSNNNPLVELDVVSHEFTHGVTQYEAGLLYSYEPGALNESFSDIMAKAVEFRTFGDTATWQLGIHYRPGGIRDMSNPNLLGQADTYAGNLWHVGDDDYGGVHYNSGVQNFWYYLLCNGGSGINDMGWNYSINAIGIEAATRITYRSLTEYLISSSDYLDARIGSQLAAADLYGENSAEYLEVNNAWDAVGVIDEPIVRSLNVYDVTATTAKITGDMLPRGNSATYRFEYGTTPALGLSSENFPYNGTIEGILTGLQSQTTYYLRVAATNENGTAYYNANPFTTISLAPLVEIDNSIERTETTIAITGKVNPNNLPTTYHIEYGLTLALGQSTAPVSLPDGAFEYIDVSAEIINLLPRRTYYYKIVATNSFTSVSSNTLSAVTAVRPQITSFTPSSGPIDTEVTLSGINFNPVSEMNQVSFGATVAQVISASATELKVRVPAGASLAPISVLDLESGLAAKSGREFVQTFNGDFHKTSMQLRMGTDDVRTYGFVVQDMDGDNKPDIVVSTFNGFRVMLNLTQGEIGENSFVTSIHNSTGVADDQIYVADLDGDGRKDVIIRGNSKVRVFPNLSVPGFIFFGQPVDVPTDPLYDLALEDVDEDGRIDIAGLCLSMGNFFVTVYRNSNTKGALSANGFRKEFQRPVGEAVAMTSGDIDDDGAPDLVISLNKTSSFSILKNNSQYGMVDFEELIIPDPLRPRNDAYYLASDLNQDGRLDVFSYAYNGKLNTFENTGESGETKLAEPLSVFNISQIATVGAGDLDGDGKVDLVAANGRGTSHILLNTTEANEPISSSSFQDFLKIGIPILNQGSNTRLTISDLNGDGRPDIIHSNGLYSDTEPAYQLEIWQNSANKDCTDPFDITVTTDNNSATIILPPNTTLDDFEFEYQGWPIDPWEIASSTKLSNLEPGHQYSARVRSKCYLYYTSYHEFTFTTECENLSSFAITGIGANSISISASNIHALNIQYTIAGKDEWITVPRYTFQISNLLPGTLYDLRYRGNCQVPGAYKYQQFTTDCPNLSLLTVTNITHNSAQITWTSGYQGGNAIIEYSDDNTNWIPVTTPTISSLIPGKQYFVRGKIQCPDITSGYQQYSFTTNCPQALSLTVNDITPYTARITWTDNTNTNNYTVSYVSAMTNSKVAVHTTEKFIDIEGLSPGTDYTVTVTPHCFSNAIESNTSFTSVCFSPFNLEVDNISTTSAHVLWEDEFGGVPYYINYCIAGSDDWKTIVHSSTDAWLTKLRPSTTYEVRVHISCANVVAPYVYHRFDTNPYEATTFGPNPTDDLITIHPSKNLIGNRYTLTDNAGRLIASGILKDYQLDLSGLSSGLYILNIEGENPMKIFKHNKP